MEDLMIVLGGVVILVALAVGAWFFGTDSRDSGDRGTCYERPELGPGHRPTWF